MNAKRPNQQLWLPFTQAEPGETRAAPLRQGVAACVTPSVSESPVPSAAGLMEALCSPARRRLRSLSWRAWRTPRKRFRELTRRGTSAYDAVLLVRHRQNPWRASRMPALNAALPNRLWHDRLGLLSLHSCWRRMRTQS